VLQQLVLENGGCSSSLITSEASAPVAASKRFESSYPRFRSFGMSDLQEFQHCFLSRPKIPPPGKFSGALLGTFVWELAARAFLFIV
jgi:hypothetical protein